MRLKRILIGLAALAPLCFGSVASAAFQKTASICQTKKCTTNYARDVRSAKSKHAKKSKLKAIVKVEGKLKTKTDNDWTNVKVKQIVDDSEEFVDPELETEEDAPILFAPWLGINTANCTQGISGWAAEPVVGGGSFDNDEDVSIEVYADGPRDDEGDNFVDSTSTEGPYPKNNPNFSIPIPEDYDTGTHTFYIYAVNSEDTITGPGVNGPIYGSDPITFTGDCTDTTYRGVDSESDAEDDFDDSADNDTEQVDSQLDN